MRIQRHILAFKFSRAAGELTQEHGESACARGRQESAVFMWTDGWIITKIAHKLLAFNWRWSGQREKALWQVACNYHGSLPDSAPRSWAPLMQSFPINKWNNKKKATTTLKRPWVCHLGCERSSIRSFQTLGPLDVWVTNRLVDREQAKPRGREENYCFFSVCGGENCRKVWSMSDTEEWWEDGGGWVGYERRDCQQHINTLQSAQSDICPSRCSHPSCFFP